MAETITVTVPELPLVSAPNGDELIAVWDQGRLSRIPQGALRGTRTYSGFGDPPATPSEIMALSPIPVLDDRWRNPETGDEWKVTSLDPFVWTPDGNVKGADGASTVPGPPGAPGERGATGPSGRTLTKTAGETIPDWRAVILDTNGQFRLADPSNPTHRQRVVGVVPYGGSGLATLVAQTAGDVTGPASNFNPAAALFVGSGGLLTSTPPTSGWRQIVATAVSSSQIVVALSEARVVADEGTALVVPGGFASPASTSDVSAGAATDKFVTPAALDPVLSAKVDRAELPEGGFPAEASADDVEAGLATNKFVTPAALDPALSGKLGLAAFVQAAASFNLPSSNKTILDWLADLMVEGAELRALGFVGDGQSHPLSQRFGTGSAGLAAAKAVFPRAVALTEEIDGHAIQRRVDLAVAGNYGACVVLPRAATALTSFPIDSTGAIACHVSSPGGAVIKCVGASAGCWTHGTAAARASSPIIWRGVDLDSASSASATTGLTTFFGAANVGATLAVTVENARFMRMTTAWKIGNMPRGLKADNVVAYGADNQLQPGGGIEIVTTADVTYGSFSYKFTNCLTLNYTWGWLATAASSLEGIVWENCRSYAGWGLCRAISTKPNYRILLLTFQDCDWEGRGFALDMTNVRTMKVVGGFWFMRSAEPGAIPAAVQTDGGERRMFNLHNVSGFDVNQLEMVAGGGGDNDPLPTNLVLVNVDADCELGVFDGNIVVTDHVTATCIFRLSGRKASTIVERNTRVNYTWGTTPTALYAGSGDQPYQVSTSDAAANTGSATSAGLYEFSGVAIVTTGAGGRASVPLPRRAPGTLPFFRNAPSVRITSANSNGSAAAFTLVSTSSTAFVIEAVGAPTGVTAAIHWEASGF